MGTRLNPYVNFQDDTRAAMEFYKSVLGGELSISTFGEMGNQDTPDLVMHAMLETPSGFTLMAADTPPGMEFSPGARMSISLSGDADDELRGYWDGLGDGATVIMPLEKQVWGDEFGMLVDKFGIQWMVNIAGPENLANRQ